MRVLAELLGVQVLATYTDIPPLPNQKSSETCRRPIACLLPDVGTIMKERLPMDDIDMGNEAILRRVATLRVTLGVALQKLLLAGLHVPCSETDRLLDKLNNMLGNAGDNVKARARLEKCIAHCNRMWMEDSEWQRKSLTDLLCGIEKDDDRVQEKRFPQVVVLDDILLREEDDDSLSPANLLHLSCQGVFRQALKTIARAAVTAGKILEYAHLWVLACRSCNFSLLNLMSWWLDSSAKTSSRATSFGRTARHSTLPKLQRCKTPLSIMPRGTIRVPTFSSRMTLVLCIWLMWVAPATCRRL